MTESLTLKAYTHVLSSDYFYPSNVALRHVEDRGSIRYSIPVSEINIFDTGEKQNHGVIAKVIRVIARSFAMLAVAVFVAPLGAAWHLSLTCYHTFHLMAVGQDKEHHWQQVSLHIKAFMTDFIIALPALYGATCCALPTLIDSDLLVIGLIWTGLLTGISGLSPDKMASYLAWQNERPALVKAILLKNEFGIVSHDHAILQRDTQFDQEYPEAPLKGHFGDLYLQQGLLFLEAVKELQTLLPAEVKFIPSYPPTADKVTGFLSRSSARIGTSLDIDAWTERFNQLENNLKAMGRIFKNCCDQKAYVLGRDAALQITYKLPEFPWPKEFCDYYFTKAQQVPPQPGSGDPWLAKLDQQISDLKEYESKLEDEEKAAINKSLEGNPLLEYRDRIFERKTPRQFFDLKPDYTLKDLNAKYRKAAIAFHPDKVPDNYRKQAGMLFDCATTAKEILEKELS